MARDGAGEKCNPVPAGQTTCLCALLSKACPGSRMALPPKCRSGLQLLARLVSFGFSLVILVSVLSLSVAAGPSCLQGALGCRALRAKGSVPGGGVAAKGQHWQTQPRGHGRAALAQGPLGARPWSGTCSRARTHDSPRSLRCANKEERQG